MGALKYMLEKAGHEVTRRRPAIRLCACWLLWM